jgi:hypothetical protein
MTREVATLPELGRLFRWLALGADGDVEEALRRMERLNGRYGFFDEGMSAEEFRERMLEEGQIVESETGRLELSRRGERSIRRDALDRIFSRMRAGRPGDHRTPAAGSGGRACRRCGSGASAIPPSTSR